MVENTGLDRAHFRENECEEEESIVRNNQKKMEKEKKRCDRSHKDLVNQICNI